MSLPANASDLALWLAQERAADLRRAARSEALAAAGRPSKDGRWHAVVGAALTRISLIRTRLAGRLRVRSDGAVGRARGEGQPASALAAGEGVTVPGRSTGWGANL
jgi:hypothetical protein